MKKKSMSVMEMAKLIGLKKTTAYWLVNKRQFEVRIVSGKRRIMMDSFNDWLSRQSHYKIVAAPDCAGEKSGGKDGVDC